MQTRPLFRASLLGEGTWASCRLWCVLRAMSLSMGITTSPVHHTLPGWSAPS